MTYSVNIIGAGTVGKTLAALLVRNKIVEIGAVQNQSRESSLKAIQFIGAGRYYEAHETIPKAEFTFITTPDDKIEAVCQDYAAFFIEGSIVLHCSGAWNAQLLSTAKNAGCYIASAHPLRSFKTAEQAVLDYKGTYCAIEGDEESIPAIKTLFTAIGSIPFVIDSASKPFYHIAAIFASNYLVTLAKEACCFMEKANLDSALAFKLTKRLMHTTLANLENVQQPEAALTGPIQRGDKHTIHRHLAALAKYPQQKSLYKALGTATLEKCINNPEIQEMLVNLFCDY